MARWSGPPPLLIAATVLGVVVALTAGGSGDEPHAVRARTVAEVTSPAPSVTPSVTPTATTTAVPPTTPPTTRPTTPVAVEPEAPDAGPPADVLAPPVARRAGPPRRQLLGLATFNQDRSQPVAAAQEDAAAIVGRPGVSIVAWQEGEPFGSVYATLKGQGWATVHPRVDGRPGELAISWRSARFRLVSAKLRTVVYRTESGEAPYGSRHVLRVTLRERTSRRLVTVVDTHLPTLVAATASGVYRNPVAAARGRMQLEAVDKILDRARGRWVLGAGDYGFGSYAELEQQPRGGMSRVFAGTVLSTYAVRGTEGLDPTDTVRHRYSDYVQVDRVQLDRGRIEVVGHRTLDQVTSDHRPLIAWLALS